MPKAKPIHTESAHSAQSAPLLKEFEQLKKHQGPDRATRVGERLAAAILAKSEDELKASAGALNDSSGNTMVEYLAAAEDSLKQRHCLVCAAIARMRLVAASTE